MDSYSIHDIQIHKNVYKTVVSFDLLLNMFIDESDVEQKLLDIGYMTASDDASIYITKYSGYSSYFKMILASHNGPYYITIQAFQHIKIENNEEFVDWFFESFIQLYKEFEHRKKISNRLYFVSSKRTVLVTSPTNVLPYLW